MADQLHTEAGRFEIPDAAPAPADLTEAELNAALEALGHVWKLGRPLGLWTAEQVTRAGGHETIRYLVARSATGLAAKIMDAERDTLADR